MNVDPEFLINEVQNRPSLWDTSDEDYKDTKKKNGLWASVCSSLFPNFNEKTEPQQKVI
ncbi:hypothetical protein PV326_001834, partial [Microctonus aethiopoides]